MSVREQGADFNIGGWERTFGEILQLDFDIAARSIRMGPYPRVPDA